MATLDQALRCTVVAVLLTANGAAAYAQGGGASSTGTIQGRVTDGSGAVLPGVMVTASSASLIGGALSSVSDDQGTYRFPALAPGTYRLVFSLSGFASLTREGIQISLGFTANIPAQLAVASLQESVTVSGGSPVIDSSTTRVQQNFTLQQLNSIPNARDMWALLALTPSVQLSRVDVGGNRAGTQTGYTAYGYGTQDQQVRVLVEGINTTEGTVGAGFYFDYGSFEEAFLGTAGNSAEMPHPGVQSQFLGKSGGNRFSGTVHADWYNDSLQASNIPDALTNAAAFGGNPIRRGSNEMQQYRDFNASVGGRIVKDKLWWYASYRDQKNSITQPNFLFDATFDTRLWNPSAKATYLVNRGNKLIGYYQWGQKVQPLRLFGAAYSYASPDATRRQDSGSWVYKGEWNGTLSRNIYAEARYGEFGYYFPLVGYSDAPWRQDDGLRTVEGGDWRWQQDRQRRQATAAATLFTDNLIAGAHSLKLGAEYNVETQWNGISRYRAGGVQHIFSNGQAFRVAIGFPSANCDVGGLSARDCLLSIAQLDHSNAFVSDTWAIGRVTVNAGLRFDHYRSHIPGQSQVANTISGFSLPAATFPAQTFATWNSVVPRIGLTYAVDNDARSVFKVNYGFFRHNPGPTLAANGNPNQSGKLLTYTWTDINGDRLFQFGEQNALVSDLTGPGGIQIDPNIRQPYTHEVATFLERQIGETLGLRLGYVYKTNDDLTQPYQPFRGPEAYTSSFTHADIGADGLQGTQDDRTISLRAIPTAQLGPATTVVMTVPGSGRYNTVEASANRRFANRWSGGVGYNFTWTQEHGNTYGANLVSAAVGPGFPNSGNDPGVHRFTTWGLRAFGSYDGPYGLRVSPVVRHQSGQPYGRTLSVTNVPAGLFASGTVLVEPLNTRRQDNTSVIDLRVERSFGGGTTRIRTFVDAFNVSNSSAAETISYQTGSGFERPTAILAPRTFRVGARLDW